jgi:hypothetical protein
MIYDRHRLFVGLGYVDEEDESESEDEAPRRSKLS